MIGMTQSRCGQIQRGTMINRGTNNRQAQGDIDAMTKGGEVIALLTGFLGVCMAAILTGIVASAFANQMSRKKSSYQAQLRQVLADDTVTDAEKNTLKRLQTQFRLSDKEVQTMMEQARAGKKP